MMPLIYAPVGEENIILKVGGNAQIRSHLESMGFVCGAAITVIATREALSKIEANPGRMLN